MLIASLLVGTLLLVLGLAYLGKRADQMRAASRDQEATRALQIALAGLESVRVKLDFDPEFPPTQNGQFAYSENVTDLDGLTLLGSYDIVVDAYFNAGPYRLLRVTSEGLVIENGQVLARRTVLGEFDMSQSRGRYYDLVNFQDLGSN